MTSDDNAMAASTSNHCATVQDTGCPAAAAQVISALHKWLDDLNTFRTPVRFGTIDAQMRRHLSAAIADLNAVIAANRARNQSAEDLAFQSAESDRGWVDGATAGIADSYQGSTGTYRDLVQSEKVGVDSCIDCQRMADPNQLDCSVVSSCSTALFNTAAQIGSFQSGIVRTAAPASFTSKDARLQSDLGQTDTALIAMTEAMRAGDKAAFNAARMSYQRALALLDADATAITTA